MIFAFGRSAGTPSGSMRLLQTTEQDASDSAKYCHVKKRHATLQSSAYPPPPPGGDSPYEKVGGARRTAMVKISDSGTA